MGYALLDAFPFLHHQRHRGYCVFSQVRENGRCCCAYEQSGSCDDRILAGIATGLKRQRVNAIACDVEPGDFCYFSLVCISVAVSVSSWESACVSSLAAGTEIGSRRMANVCGDAEKESGSDGDEAEVSASEIDVVEASFGGRSGYGTWNALESASV